jgi:peptidyl-prolyl cis-trans isomerase SurA
MLRRLLAIPLLALSAAALQGQATPPSSTLVCPQPADSAQVDRVVAVVGDSVILFTELQQECRLAEQSVLEAARNGQQPAPITVEQILDNLIDVQVMLQHAAKDSTVMPSAEDVTRAVNMQMDTVRAGFANEAAFQQALTQQGLTLQAYREELTSQLRTRMIQQAFTMRLMQNAPTPVVTEAEMREFFEGRRADLQALPELLTVQQVLIRSGASDSAWARALQKADSIYALAIRGVDFPTLARENSQDPGSAQNNGGGDLGAISRGGTVPEFERAAFSLRDGGISVPIRTEYGYHIIKVDRTRGTQKLVRHILIVPDSDPSDLERTRTLGQDVANRIRAGESTLRLAQEYGDPSIPREMKVPRGQEADAMPPELAERLTGARQGDVIGPFDANLNGLQYIVVMNVTQVREPGQLTFEEARDQVRDIVAQQKRQERVYQQLRDKTYVEIRYGR